MKSKFFLLAVAVSILLYVTGCSYPASPNIGNDGTTTNVVATPFVYNYKIDSDFKYQIWAEATGCTFETLIGAIKVKTPAAGWAGGGLAVSMGDTTNTLNLTNVKKLNFSVSGNQPANTVRVYIQVSGADVTDTKKFLSDYGYTINTTDTTQWTDVSITLPADAQKYVSNAFVFVVESPAVTNSWVAFKNIDWVGADGKSVNIMK
jgi:hypothetical protein